MLTGWRTFLLMTASLTLAAGSGFLVSQVYGAGNAASARTVTVNIGTGETGPQGPPGPPGPGITMKGQVATVADLPATGNKPGDTYVVTANNSIQTWDGSKWVVSGSFDAGLVGCPTGYTAGALVLNAPGGHTQIWTCLQD
jgi:hypothetical protein